MASPTRYGKLGFTANKDNPREAYMQIGQVALPVVASAAEQTTTYVFPSRCVIVGCYLDVETAEVTGLTKTLDVGLDTAGAAVLGNNLSTAATGSVLGLGGVVADGDTLTYTLGSADWVEFEGQIILDLIAQDV